MNEDLFLCDPCFYGSVPTNGVACECDPFYTYLFIASENQWSPTPVPQTLIHGTHCPVLGDENPFVSEYLVLHHRSMDVIPLAIQSQLAGLHSGQILMLTVDSDLKRRLGERVSQTTQQES